MKRLVLCLMLVLVVRCAGQTTAPLPLRQLMDTPLRDTFICRGPDGVWYLTGTVEPFWDYNEGIQVWKSADLKIWQPLGWVWKYGDSPWHKPYLEARKPLWAPEIHYLKGTFWLTYSLPGWDGTARTSGSGLLRSTTGSPEGPYVDVQPEERLGDEIDASLFEDNDGTVYFLWHSGKIARMKPDLSGLAESYRWLKTSTADSDPGHHSGLCAGIFGEGSYDHVGYEGMSLFQAGGRYYLSCAENFEGRYSCTIATATNLFGPYGPRYEAIPHAGHNGFFKDPDGQWWSTYFGSDGEAPWRERPGILPVEIAPDGSVRPGPWPAGLHSAVTPVVSGRRMLFHPGAVRLLEGPFKTMQDADHAYLVRLEPDRLLAQFRVEAGLEPRAKPYGGWESPAQPGRTWSLAGHSLGHYLSALSWMYRITDDERLLERVAYIARELKACQDQRGDGSLVAFPALRELEADIRAGKVESIDRYWAPFYTIHKELAGLRDAWLWCGDATARRVLTRLADWCGSLVRDLSDEDRERFLAMEHGGMAEVLADVYAITGERKYLDDARRYAHRALLDPLAAGNDILTGKHANTQVPKFIGFQRIHELAGDAASGAAAAFFWQTVVADRTWVNGGNSMHEHFPEPAAMGEHLTDTGGPETCNTYNMLRLTAALYRERPDSAYVDYYENALYNHILASQAPLVGAGAFVYYTPLRPGFARSYGTDFGSFWCCTGTGMENPARYGELIYTHDEQALCVNLFIASELQWSERGFALRQETRFPDESGTTLVIVAAPEEALTLRIRHPFWLASDGLEIRVNGRSEKITSRAGGFGEVTRAWRPGDSVSVALPMKLRVVRQAQCPGWVSLFHGPILLAGELGRGGLSQADFIGGYTPVKALRPLAEAPVFLADTDASILERVRPEPGRRGSFRTEGLVKPHDVTLTPFFRVHFQRYAFYWQLSDPERWEERRREIAEAERREREVDARTVDRVRIGEQQPEIDHALRFEQSSSGSGPQDRRWRDARDGGWFSYDLKLPSAGVPVSVRVLYWGGDDGRAFDLQINGEVIASPALRGGKDDYYAVEYPVPEALREDKEAVTVRFQSHSGQTAGGVYDLRLVRGETPNPTLP